MKATAILRVALLGALAAATARAWDFQDELDSPTPAPAKLSSPSPASGGNSSVNDEQRIYGGTEADASLYKYIVSLRKTAEGSTYCGGSLIAPQYVVTAAHCIKETGTMYASIGSASATGTSDGERIAVAEYYVHPKYDKANHLFDIAILKLSAKSAVTPVPLASADGSDNKENTMAVVRGWGMTETKVPASTLQEVNVRIITNAACNKQYNNRITEGMLCAGEGGGKDSCQGDSGGPLVSNNKLIGLVSWGGECGAAAGVYTRVSFVLDFINEKIGGGAATNATKEASPAPATTEPATTAPVTTAPVTTAPTPVVTLATLAPSPVPEVTVAPTTVPVATAAPTPVVTLATLSPTPVATLATLSPTPVATLATLSPTPVATLATLSPTTAPSTEYPEDVSSATGDNEDAKVPSVPSSSESSAGGDDEKTMAPTVPESTPAATTAAPTTAPATVPATKPTSTPSSSSDGCSIKNKDEKQKEKEAKRAAKKLAREEKKKAKEAEKKAKEAEKEEKEAAKEEKKKAKEAEKSGATKSNGGSADLGNDPTQSN